MTLKKEVMKVKRIRDLWKTIVTKLDIKKEHQAEVTEEPSKLRKLVYRCYFGSVIVLIALSQKFIHGIIENKYGEPPVNSHLREVFFDNIKYLNYRYNIIFNIFLFFYIILCGIIIVKMDKAGRFDHKPVEEKALKHSHTI